MISLEMSFFLLNFSSLIRTITPRYLAVDVNTWFEYLVPYEAALTRLS